MALGWRAMEDGLVSGRIPFGIESDSYFGTKGVSTGDESAVITMVCSERLQMALLIMVFMVFSIWDWIIMPAILKGCGHRLCLPLKSYGLYTFCRWQNRRRRSAGWPRWRLAGLCFKDDYRFVVVDRSQKTTSKPKATFPMCPLPKK